MFLTTDRLVIRRLTDGDFLDFSEFLLDPERSRMMGTREVRDIREAREAFNWFLSHEKRAYALTLRGTGKVIGNLTIYNHPQIERREALRGKEGRALSFSMSRLYRRRGLTEEAVRAVIGYLFRTEGVDYINCGCFSFNEPSRALQRKLGFEPFLTEQIEIDGEPIECIENILWNR